LLVSLPMKQTRIERLRLAAHISRRDLARAAHINERTVYAMEQRQTTRAHDSVKFGFSAALGKPVAYLFDAAGGPR